MFSAKPETYTTSEHAFYLTNTTSKITAEILARPILHATEAKEHTFYIIDNNTKHQQPATSISKRK